MKYALDILRRAAGTCPDRLALDAEGMRLTFAALLGMVEENAKRLEGEGIGKGDLVPVFASEYSAFFVAMLSLWQAGAVVVPMNMSLPEPKRDDIVQRVGAAHAVWADPDPDSLLGVRATELQDARRVEVPDDVCLVLFTSGSTGLPKGVPCSHSMIVGNALAMAAKLELDGNDRVFVNTPPYYTSAICHLLTCHAACAGVVARAGFFFGADLLSEAVRAGCTGFGGAPAHIARLAETLEPGHGFDGLRFFMTSGDHLPVPLIDKMGSLFPASRLFCVYGLTEVAGRLCVLDPDRIRDKKGSAGKPLGAMQLEVVDEDGRPLPAGEIGEVRVRGPMLMSGYLGLPPLADSAPSGWFPTGDQGYLDDEGFLFLAGRRDDVFKSGGEKVSTKYIEQALMESGMVADQAVLALEDPFMGKAPVAFVVPLKSGFDRRGVLKKLKAALPHTHIPKRFVVVDELPRTGSGKIVKQELEKRIEDKR